MASTEAPVRPELALSPAASRTYQTAKLEAIKFRHDFVGTEHLLLALCMEKSDEISLFLQSKEVTQGKVRTGIEFVVGRGRADSTISPMMTPRLKAVMAYANEEAQKDGDVFVEQFHLFEGLAHIGRSRALQLLEQLGITADQLLPEIAKLRFPEPQLAGLSPSKDRQAAGSELSKAARAIRVQRTGTIAFWEFGEFETKMNNYPKRLQNKYPYVQMDFIGKNDSCRIAVSSVVPEKKKNEAFFVGMDSSIVDFYEVACRALEDGVRPSMIESAARGAINGYKRKLPKDYSRGDRYLHDKYLHEMFNWAWELRNLFGKKLSEKKYL